MSDRERWTATRSALTVLAGLLGPGPDQDSVVVLLIEYQRLLEALP